MKRHHYGILAATLLLLGVLLGYSFFKNDAVPVARVGGDIILLREVRQNAEVSGQLYAQAPELVGARDRELATLFERGDSEALFARSLESAIMSAAIRASAPADVLRQAQVLASQSVAQTNVRTLGAILHDTYGWDLETFTERVIEPQVLRQVLAERHGEEYETWLEQVRRNANVSLWLVPFDWHNGELIEK